MTATCHTKKFLVPPPGIDRTMANIAVTGVRQMANSETQKFGHVTYSSRQPLGQVRREARRLHRIAPDRVPIEQLP
jgi:2,3-bisphosphoglycerate-independent phosphoglycerate mutase